MVPENESHDAFPRSQAPEPVTIPLVVVTHETDAIVAPAAPLILRLAPGTKLMSPVEAEPMVNVCLLVVKILPLASNERALLEAPEILAVGVPEFTPVKANLALAVETPPTRRSRVAILGKRVPFT